MNMYFDHFSLQRKLKSLVIFFHDFFKSSLMLQSNSFRFGMIYLRVVFWEINQLCNWGYSVILQKNQLNMLYLVQPCLLLGQLVVHIRVPTILRFLAHQNLYYITIRFPNRPSVNHFFILQRPFWVLIIKTNKQRIQCTDN